MVNCIADLVMQNSEIEMAATAITQMNQAVDDMARNAVATSEESKASLVSVRKGQDELSQTVTSILKLTRNVGTASIEGQALVAREVDRNLVRIRDLSTQSAVRTGQTSSAIQSLAELASGLTTTLRQFKIS